MEARFRRSIAATSLKVPRSTPNGFLNSQIVGRRIPIGTSLRPNARRNILGDGLGAVVRPPVEARVDMGIVCGPVAEELSQNRAPPPFPWLVLTKPLPPTRGRVLVTVSYPTFHSLPLPGPTLHYAWMAICDRPTINPSTSLVPPP